MNGVVLKRFVEAAKKLNQAVELEGSFDSEVIIEPEDVCDWYHVNMLWVDDQLIDVTWVTFAKVVPNKQERKRQETELLEKIRKEVGLNGL